MRLTKAHREEILENIVIHKLGKRKECLNGVMSERAFNDVIDKSILKTGFRVSMFENAQKGLFPTESCLHNHTLQSLHKGFKNHFPYQRRDDDYLYITRWDQSIEGKPRKIPHILSKNWSDDLFKIGPGEIPSLELFIKEAVALEKEYCVIKREVMTVLNSVTTLKSLKDVWPEAAQFFPEEVQRQTAKPPAVQTAELNKLLKL